jgi:phosphohistidine phosphatase SixA
MLETDYHSWIVTHNVTGYNPTMKKLGKRLTAELTGFVGDRTSILTSAIALSEIHGSWCVPKNLSVEWEKLP